MKLSDYPRTRQIQLSLLRSLQEAKKDPSRVNMQVFLYASSLATRQGIGLDHKDIEDIFDEVYKDS
jgi:hypothetical protein